jgi:uncharacterized protein YdeI (YjbR/CyaY-like superfamily)
MEERKKDIPKMDPKIAARFLNSQSVARTQVRYDRQAFLQSRIGRALEFGAMKKVAAKRFKGTLERMPGRLGWTIVRVPFDVAKLWGSRGALRVRGEINSFGFRTSLFPTGRGTHYLLINKKMQKGGGVRAGEQAEFTLEPDTKERQVVLPIEVEKIFKREKQLRRFYDSFNDSIRSYIANEVASRKSPVSRERRAEQVAEQLLETMEAERDLPPLIKNAFAEHPKAFAGWKTMTPLARRTQLLAIFYYRNLDSRARRLQKVLDAAAARNKD